VPVIAGIVDSTRDAIRRGKVVAMQLLPLAWRVQGLERRRRNERHGFAAARRSRPDAGSGLLLGALRGRDQGWRR
jgi:hypothetical protein